MVQCQRCGVWYYETGGHYCQVPTYWSTCQCSMLLPLLGRIASAVERLAPPAKLVEGEQPPTNTGSPKLPPFTMELKLKICHSSIERDDLMFDAGARAMHEYLERQLRAGA